MKRRILALGAALVLPLLGRAGESERGEGLINLTINPEARVSVELVRAPPPEPCGKQVEFRVRILNQGFITGRLEAELVGDPPARAALDFHPEPLKGVPRETRVLHIALTDAGPTDLTISFRLHDEIPDLGGRDRIHLLMRAAATP